MQENFISSSSSVKTRLKILHFYRFFRRNGSSPEICFNDGRCVSPAWVSDLLGDFHKNQEKVLKFLVEIVTKLQVIATERFLKEQKTDLSKWKSSSRGCVFGPLIRNWIRPLSPNYYVKAVYVTCNWYFRQLMLYKVKREISIFFKKWLVWHLNGVYICKRVSAVPKMILSVFSRSLRTLRTNTTAISSMGVPQTHSPWTTNRRIDNMSLTLKGPVDLVRNFTVWPNRDLKSVSHLCVSP